MDGQFRILRAGTTIVLDYRSKGQCWQLPHEAAKVIAKEILKHCAEAEEIAKANQLIEDQAILIRSQFPIGLTSNEKIHKEAVKRAEDIYIPGIPAPTNIPKINVVKEIL